MTREEIIDKACEHAAQLAHAKSKLKKLDDLPLKKLDDLPKIRFRNAAEVSFLDENDYPYITIVLESDSGALLSARQIPIQKSNEQV